MQVKENQNLISLLAFFDWAAAESKYNAYTLETNNILAAAEIDREILAKSEKISDRVYAEGLIAFSEKTQRVSADILGHAKQLSRLGMLADKAKAFIDADDLRIQNEEKAAAIALDSEIDALIKEVNSIARCDRIKMLQSRIDKLKDGVRSKCRRLADFKMLFASEKELRLAAEKDLRNAEAAARLDKEILAKSEKISDRAYAEAILDFCEKKKAVDGDILSRAKQLSRLAVLADKAKAFIDADNLRIENNEKAAAAALDSEMNGLIKAANSVERCDKIKSLLKKLDTQKSGVLKKCSALSAFKLFAENEKNLRSAAEFDVKVSLLSSAVGGASWVEAVRDLKKKRSALNTTVQKELLRSAELDELLKKADFVERDLSYVAFMKTQQKLFDTTAEKRNLAWCRSVISSYECRPKFSDDVLAAHTAEVKKYTELYNSALTLKNKLEDEIAAKYKKAISTSVKWSEVVELDKAKNEKIGIIKARIKNFDVLWKETMAKAAKNAEAAGVDAYLRHSAEALEALKFASESGLALADYYLGLCYYNPRFVSANYTEAARLFENAAKAGNKEAQFKLGFMYFEGKLISKNLEKAFSFFKMAARLDHAESAAWVGYCYTNGYGVSKNDALAFVNYKKGAELGSKFATFALANAYEKAIGTPRMRDLALQWFDKAAELGHNDAPARAAAIRDEICKEEEQRRKQKEIDDLNEKINVWFAKAQAGDALAQLEIGKCFLYGTGVDRDYKYALKFLTQSADGGNKKAMELIGDCYGNGWGVPVSYKTALLWYEKAGLNK